jgi:hypothetical protein
MTFAMIWFLCGTITLTVLVYVSFGLENEDEITVASAALMILVWLAGIVGFVLMLCLFLYFFVDEYSDKVIWRRKKE